MEAYSGLAQVYDQLMDDVDYEKWAQYLHVFLYEAGARRVFEAACGTGGMTCALARLGYDAIGADISEQMLDAAANSARRSGADAVFVLQDMRSITVGNRVDAVVCACDGPNYIDETGLRRFAASSFAALKPSGLLLFDINTRHKLMGIMDGQVYFDDREDVTCIWQNTFDSAADALKTDVTVFIRHGLFFERSSEQHIQYAHDIPAVQRIMREAGFASVEVYDAFTKNPWTEKSQRVQFVCTRE